jgi:hypothetical protein
MRYSQASRCGTPLLSTVLTLKSDPGHRRQTQVCTDSPTSKSQHTLATASFLTHFIISIAVLENVPLTQGYRKEPLFHTKRRSGLDRESNPGHLHSRQRR